ncbi:MAG: glycosyltransferase [Nitriliruptor sp.]|nr:MAG: glycosyltransferase [Nitriliruptor sp.]
MFGTFDAERHPRVEVLEAGLAALGFDLVRCNVPWDAPTAQRVRAIRNPLVALRLLARLLRCWVRLWRRGRDIGPVDVVVTGYLGVLDIHLARRRWPDAVHVLDHLAPVGATIADRTGRRGLLQRMAERIDTTACGAADLVVVDTEEHLPATGGVVVPVGAPDRWFDVDDGRSTATDPLRVVFFGLYTPLQGTETIARAVRALELADVSVHVTLIGSGQDRPAVRSILLGVNDVEWLPWVEPADLPSVVAEHDVCLGIFGTTSKAYRVVPNKVYQGAAAGCAVVTSDTPPQRRVLVRGARFVPPGDPAALAAVLAELAVDRSACRALGSAARDLARQEFRSDRVVSGLVAALSAR